MKKKYIPVCAAAFVFAVYGCRGSYEVAGIEKERLLVDSRYDQAENHLVDSILAPYKHQVDSLMSPVVGKLVKDVKAVRPEGELSNLLADIMVWAGDRFGERPVMGVYNMGGIRAALSAGDVTYGDILEVAPFENKICFLTLSGADLMTLFQQIAAVGGEGVSKGVEMVVTADRRLESVTLNGKRIEPTASYRIATIDYLAQGNDRLEAFKLKTDLNAPAGKENNSREIIMEYFKYMMKKGRAVDANIEGRIKIAD